MLTWLNDNQGFVMSVLTLVYVVATICILISNRKSANAATIANKQQLALQLLERRFNSYYMLHEWISIAKTLLIQNFSTGNPLDAFNAMLYNNAKDKELESINNQLNLVETYLSQDSIPADYKEQLLVNLKKLTQERFFKRCAMLDVENGLINQIEILFPQIEFELIKSFSSSFIDAAVNSNTNNLEQVKHNVQKILDKDILGSLWKVIKDI